VTKRNKSHAGRDPDSEWQLLACLIWRSWHGMIKYVSWTTWQRAQVLLSLSVRSTSSMRSLPLIVVKAHAGSIAPTAGLPQE